MGNTPARIVTRTSVYAPIILRKKDLVIARSNLDITDEIIDLVNTKVKKINLN